MPKSPQEAARDPDRAAAVAGRGDRDHPGGNRRRAAAARPAGTALQVPGVAGDAVGGRLGEAADRQLRHQGQPDDDRARLAQPPHHLRVVGGGLGEAVGPVRVDLAGDVDLVLDRDRHPEQGPLLAGLQPCFGLLGFEQRLLGEHLAKCVQLRVEAGDSVEAQLDQLGRGDLPRPQHLRLPRRAGEGDILIGDRCAPLHGGHRIRRCDATLFGERSSGKALFESDGFEKRLAPQRSAIERFASRQHGLVTAGQLREAGLTSAAISKRVRSERLHRLHRGVYGVGTYPGPMRQGGWPPCSHVVRPRFSVTAPPLHCGICCGRWMGRSMSRSPRRTAAGPGAESASTAAARSLLRP